MDEGTPRIAEARDAFLAWADREGYTLAQPLEWRGTKAGHPALCPEGHPCAPWPGRVRTGSSGCATCGRARIGATRASEARDAFLAWADREGYALAQPLEWRGTGCSYPAVCPEGHACAPWPGRVRTGSSGCATCGHAATHASGKANRDGSAKYTDTVRGRFLAWADREGYTLAQPLVWLGADSGYPAVCPEGHACAPNPSYLRQSGSGCSACDRHNSYLGSPRSLASRDRFMAWADREGYALAQPLVWLGVSASYPAVCPKGHACAPNPNRVLKGQGGCPVCAGMVWDVFYTVRSSAQQTVKFGITSGDPRPRLRDHARCGLTEVLRLHTGLPGGSALGLERELKRLMREHGVGPVRGREYFPTAAQGVILATVDAWLGPVSPTR